MSNMLEYSVIKSLRKLGYKIIADYNSGQILVMKGIRTEMLSHKEARKIAEGMSALPCERCGRTFDHRQSDCEIDIQTEYENAGADLR